jgi:hypothetical protein
MSTTIAFASDFTMPGGPTISVGDFHSSSAGSSGSSRSDSSSSSSTGTTRGNSPTPGSPGPYRNTVYGEGGLFHPAPGFQWVNKEAKHDYRVRPRTGTQYKNHPHVVWGADGKPKPQAGFQWSRPNYLLFRGDYSVIPLPDGTPCDPGDLSSIPSNGHLVWGGNGGLRPTRGFTWLDYDAAMKWADCRVVSIDPLAEGIELPAAIEDSPGVREARKGAEVAATGDWNAAHAWYLAAFRKDPRNQTLKRMVQDAEEHLKRSR